MNKTDIEFNKNEDALLSAVADVQHKLDKISLGGGKERIVKQHGEGKLTARERIKELIDKDSYFFEIGAFAGFEMYEEHGGCPAGGVVLGLGRVEGRLVMIVANDATVKAGAWFPITAKKNLRAQEIAMENRIPIIYLVDSAGVYLPLQDEIFADKEHFGRIFRNNAKISSMGIPQIAAIMGSCVAGGAYLPIMSDEALIVEGTGSIFLAGPYLVNLISPLCYLRFFAKVPLRAPVFLLKFCSCRTDTSSIMNNSLATSTQMIVDGAASTESEILTVLDVARFLRVPKSTVYKLARLGELPASKIGKHWRFLRRDINQWMHSRSSQG